MNEDGVVATSSPSCISSTFCIWMVTLPTCRSGPRNRLTDVVSPTEHVDVAPIRDAGFVTYYGELSIHEVWAIHPPEAASFSSPRKGTQFRVCEEKAPPFRVGRMSIAACCRAPPFRGPMKSIFDPAGNQRKVGKMQDLRHSPNVPLVCLP
jgi:hypothetical protein